MVSLLLISMVFVLCTVLRTSSYDVKIFFFFPPGMSAEARLQSTCVGLQEIRRTDMDTHANSSMSGYVPAVQSGFSAGPAFQSPPQFLPSEQNLHQGVDPNSPAAFQQTLQIIQERVARLHDLARNTLAGM